MDVEVAPLIIDLGYERGEPPTYRAPTRATVPSWFPMALLTALILVCASASAPPPKSPLSAVFQLPVGPADGYALTDTGQLLAQSFGQLSSYDLATGRVVWRAGQSSPSYRLRTADGLVLMRPLGFNGEDPGTTAVAVGTGVARWQRPGNVLTMPGSSTLLAVDDLRSLPFAAPGQRVQGTIDAIDPLTGAIDWMVVVPQTAVLLGVPGLGDEDGRMLLVRGDQTASVTDLADGHQLASARLPAADYGPENPTIAGGLILLRHPSPTGIEISAYDPTDLKQIWTVPAEGTVSVQACGDVACLIGVDGLRGLDPATGDILWSRPNWQTVEQEGGVFVAYGGAGDDEPIGVVDPDSGALQVRLDGWRPVSSGGSGDELLVTRTDDSGTRTMVAVARPGAGQPQLLGQLPAGTGDCQTASDRLVCRSMYGQLVVWAYRSKG